MFSDINSQYKTREEEKEKTAFSPRQTNRYVEANEQFAETSYTRLLSTRALTYLNIGYPVHLRGPAGTGKTTIALFVAAQLGKPVLLIHGHDEFSNSDLIGKTTGYQRSQVIDNYIHTVTKTEEAVTALWKDNRLTIACEKGYTLVYDEFNRSRAEVNNIFLSVLSEGILNLPMQRQKNGAGYIEVHPNFRVIFTSNAEEYVGVHDTQNALADRFVTLEVNYPDKASEIEIVSKRSGLCRDEVEVIINIANSIRHKGGHGPSMRKCIAVARVLVYLKCPANMREMTFQTVCQDILGVDIRKILPVYDT